MKESQKMMWRNEMGRAFDTEREFESERALDSVTEWLRRKISRFDIALFVAAFVLGLFVHMYMFTHKFINHDDIGGLYSACEFGLTSGRWLLNGITKLVGGFSSSWLNGLVGIICLATAVVFVAKLFGVRHCIPALLMAFTMVSFPVVASTYSYMFCSYQYLVSLLFCAMGAYFIYTGRIWRALLGSVLIAVGMGCYQAYFAFAAALLVAVLGIDICYDRYEGNWKRILLMAMRCVVSLALAMVLYMVILKLCLWIKGAELTEYQGINAMGRITFGELKLQTRRAYAGFFKFFSNKEIFRGHVFAIVIAMWALGAVATVVMIVRKKVYRSVGAMVLLAGDYILLPLGAQLVYVMVGGSGGVHFVMQYAMVVSVLLPLIFADRMTLEKGAAKAQNRWTAALTALLLVLQLGCGYEFFLTTNRAYFDMDVTYESVYAYYVKLTAKLELQEGYTKDTPVALIGTADIDIATPPTYMTGCVTGPSAANFYSRTQFLYYFLATTYNWAGGEICELIQNTAVFQEMPCYPAEGSIATIGGVVVVKLS